MTKKCTKHDWQFATTITDPYNTIQLTQFAYYYCKKCLKTVREPVELGLSHD